MSSRVARKVASYMRDEGISAVGWGDGWILDAVGTDAVRVKTPHPLNRMRALFAHLERSPDIFSKTYRRSVDAAGREKIVRVFRLKGSQE